MQKIINVFALASAAVSVAVVGSGLYVYVNKDAILDGVKSQVMESVTGSIGGLGGDLPVGTPDLGNTPQASAPGGGSMGLPVPNSF